MSRLMKVSCEVFGEEFGGRLAMICVCVCGSGRRDLSAIKGKERFQGCEGLIEEMGLGVIAVGREEMARFCCNRL